MRFGIALVVGLSLLSSIAWGEPPELRVKLIEQSVIPAYESGNVVELAKATNRLIGKLSEEELAEVNAYLKGRDKPPIGEMLLSARAASAVTGGRFTNPKPTPHEAVLMLPIMLEQAKNVRKALAALPVLTGDPRAKAKDLPDYALMLEEIASAQRTAGMSSDVMKQAASLAAMLKSRRVNVSEVERSEMTEEYRRAAEVLATLHEETQEREVELRLARLRDAVQILRESKSLKERFVAANLVDADGGLLTEYFKSRKPDQPFLSPTLDKPEIATEVNQLVAEGERIAGDLIGKSRMLFTGLHWWLLGRYGRSGVFAGLVKPETRDPTSPFLVELPEGYAEFDQAQEQQFPQRRHYYTWAWEERTVQVSQRGFNSPSRQLPKPPPVNMTPSSRLLRYKPKSFGSFTLNLVPVTSRGARKFGGGRAVGGGRSYGGGGGAMINISPGRQYGPINRPKSWTVADVYRKMGYPPPKPYQPNRQAGQTARRNRPQTGYRPGSRRQQPQFTAVERYVPKQDPNAVFRVVGFVEYQNALDCFDWLLEHCDQNELQAIDELLRERNELVVEVNLSRKAPNAPLNNPLNQGPAFAGDDYKRSGLKWMAALARSEVAAMLVGFANGSDAVQAKATKHDMNEYRQMIRDAARTHYWTLKDDAGLQVVLRGAAIPNRTLAYFRWLLTTKGLLQGVAALEADLLTDEQKRELLAWRTEIEQSLAVVGKHIHNYHAVDVRVNDPGAKPLDDRRRR